MISIGSAMKLEDIEKLDIAEDDQTTKLEDMIKPSDVIPRGIKEFPAKIEQSEKMRRICKNRVLRLNELLQVIEDVHLTEIENETITVTLGRKGYLPETKKKYTSEVKR